MISTSVSECDTLHNMLLRSCEEWREWEGGKCEEIGYALSSSIAVPPSCDVENPGSLFEIVSTGDGEGRGEERAKWKREEAHEGQKDEETWWGSQRGREEHTRGTRCKDYWQLLCPRSEDRLWSCWDSTCWGRAADSASWRLATGSAAAPLSHHTFIDKWINKQINKWINFKWK